MPVLSKKMEKYVKSFPERKGYTKDIKSKYNRRLIEYGITGIRNLSLMAANLPEDVQAKIFSDQVLKPFFQVLFDSAWFHTNETLSKEKRQRMLQIINIALDEIGKRLNAPLLAPKAWGIIKEMPSTTHDQIYGTNVIQALRIEGFLSSGRKPTNTLTKYFKRTKDGKTSLKAVQGGGTTEEMLR